MNTGQRASRIDRLVTEMSELCYKQTNTHTNTLPALHFLLFSVAFVLGGAFLFIFFVWECRGMYM